MIKQRLVEWNKVNSLGKFRSSCAFFLLIVCQDFLVHSDSGFAYRLQKEECRNTCFSFDHVFLQLQHISIEIERIDMNLVWVLKLLVMLKKKKNKHMLRNKDLSIKTNKNCSFILYDEIFSSSTALHSREENDTVFAQKVQKDAANQSHSMAYNTLYSPSDDQVWHHIVFDLSVFDCLFQSYYEEIDQISTNDDTSCDEQLAKILQEEEELSLASNYQSHFNSTSV